MNIYFRLFLIFFSIFLITSGCNGKEEPKKVSLYKNSSSTGKSVSIAQPNTLWFGFDLRLGPKEEVQIYAPFLKYLEKTTGRRFRIRFTRKYEDTVENLGKGITHFASLGTVSYVIGAEKYGIKYLVSGVNQEGDPRYHSVIFSTPDSIINNVRDIRGQCFSFGSKMSTQGHLIPRKMLEDEDITLDNLGKFIYTGSHINSVKAVLNGECDAGGIQDILANRLASEKRIKIIKMSDPYPSSLIAYNKSVDSTIVKAVKLALLDFEPAGKHKKLLIDWEMTEMPLGFSEIDELELNRVMFLAKRYGLLEK